MKARAAHGRSVSYTVALVVALLLAGCDTVGYYAQALGGQMAMWRATRPIEQVLGDPALSEDLRERLLEAVRIREFASSELSLPDNRSYRGYADLKRPYAVWNVFAAEALSIKPKQWCFPIAGCVAYKGFFDQARAQAYADELRGQGYDVFVGGVAAYSTLGYFADPLLNTFIGYPRTELARLIFHELAHQRVYAGGDSMFDESFAVTVEREGLRRWLHWHGTADEAQAVEFRQRRRAEFIALALAYRDKLEALYASPSSPQEQLQAKAALFDALREDYEQRKQAWSGFSGYDPWLGPEANNASLASIALYTDLVPAFEALLARQGGDLERFYARVEELAALPRAQRQARLRRIAFEQPERSADATAR